MGVYQVPEDLDEVFQSLRREPYIVNDQADTTESEKAQINQRLYTTYTNDVLSNMPSCECGETFGEHLLGPDGGDGVICESCHEPVRAKIEQEIEPLIWIRAPDGVDGFINPLFWSLLSARFRKSGNELITWIALDSYQINDRQYEPLLELQSKMQALGLKRGLNSFIRNFDAFIHILFNLRNYRARDEDADDLWRLLHERRDAVFAKHLPIPNRALLVVEESNVGTWRDPTITGAINAARIMTGIDYGSRKRNKKKVKDLTQVPDTLRQRENKSVKAIALLAQFSEDHYQKTLAQKGGLFRKHVYGSRSNWSFRAVISSITRPHRYDEMEIPWGIGLSVFRIHLYNKLERHGYTPGEAVELLNMHAYKYHPLLDALLQQLIREAPDGRIPCVLQRNPSLARASSQALYIVKVKTDPNDPTIGMSILIVKGPNADFDGDQLNATLAIDLVTADAMRALAPHMSVFGFRKPREVTGNLEHPKPVVSTTANFIHDDSNQGPAGRSELMLKMLEPA